MSVVVHHNRCRGIPGPDPLSLQLDCWLDADEHAAVMRTARLPHYPTNQAAVPTPPLPRRAAARTRTARRPPPAAATPLLCMAAACGWWAVAAGETCCAAGGTWAMCTAWTWPPWWVLVDLSFPVGSVACMPHAAFAVVGAPSQPLTNWLADHSGSCLHHAPTTRPPQV